MSETISSTDIAGDLISLFRQHTDIFEASPENILNAHREKAFKDFDRLGIPGLKHENYKYTPLEKHFTGNYDADLKANPFNIDINNLFKCDVPDLDTHVILVMNGFYFSQSLHGSLPEGVIICGLNEASHRYPELFKQHYARYADTSIDGLVALNTLFAQDGVFIYLPKNAVIEKPLQIVNMSYSGNNLRITRRNLIVADDNTTADIVVCDHTLSDRSFLTNSLTEIYVGNNAHVHYNWLQNENGQSAHISNLFIHQHDSSQFTSCVVSLHGGLIRNNFYAVQKGQHAETNLNGLFLCDGKQHVANYVLMDHASPNCISNQLFKGILDDEATGSFNGKILVRKDSQKIQAYQKNNNVLLSSTARMNSKPHLEIYADDVKCSHGATMGQLDSEALFYLRSRGINVDEARHLLMYAFANDIVSHISVPVLKERVIGLVDKRLRGELSACNDCNLRCG
jgi:Fe-S cluster assembly protein SufD